MLITITALKLSDETPIQGAIIRAYTNPALVLEAEATTDASGIAFLDLDAGDYYVMTKPPFPYISNRNALTVSISETIEILVGTPQEVSSDDPTLCTVSGYIRDIFGSHMPETEVCSIYLESWGPAVAGGRVVVPWGKSIYSDKQGWVQFDLYRGATYKVVLRPVLQDDDLPAFVLSRNVPELSAISLSNFLFPVVTSISFDPPSVSIAVDEDVLVVPTLSWSNGDITDDVSILEFEESELYDMGITQNGITLTGKSPGTTNTGITTWTPPEPETTRYPVVSVAGELVVTVT